MAYSIAKAVQKSVAGHNRPGGRASANHRVRSVRGKGNVGGKIAGRKNSTRESINTGGNYGRIGYQS